MQHSSGNYYNDSTISDRLIAVVNYVTFGLVGFVYLIINAIRKGRMSAFLQYHIFQSFFLVMLYWLLSVFVSMIAQILSFIPFINILVLKLLFYFNTPFFFGRYSVVSGTVSLIIVYLVLTSIQGMYSYFPWVSDIIKQHVRR